MQLILSARRREKLTVKKKADRHLSDMHRTNTESKTTQEIRKYPSKGFHSRENQEEQHSLINVLKESVNFSAKAATHLHERKQVLLQL